jgi:hypothetical protein
MNPATFIFSRGDEGGNSFEPSVRVYQIIKRHFTGHQLTPHSTVLLEELTVTHLLKKTPLFYSL